VLVEGFFTDLDDVFALKEIGFENGILIKERHNESGARVFGANLEGKVAWKNIFQMQLGITAQNSRYKEARSWSDDVQATERCSGHRISMAILPRLIILCVSCLWPFQEHIQERCWWSTTQV
jgi:hypothetical protein